MADGLDELLLLGGQPSGAQADRAIADLLQQTGAEAALWLACEYGADLSWLQQLLHPATAEPLHHPPADPNARDRDGVSALHLATRWHPEAAAVELLLRSGADPHPRDGSGHAPIDLAVEHDRASVAQLLLDAGAPSDERDGSDWRPLDRAVATDASRATVLTLLRAGADPNARDASGQSALHWLGFSRRINVEQRRADAARLLLDAGAHPNARDRDGTSVLHAAARQRAGTRAMAVLLEHGADPSATDRSGRTPLHLAAASGSDAVVEMLLQAGAPADATDADGNHALHLGAPHLGGRALELLLARCDPQARNQAGQSAIDRVRELQRDVRIRRRFERLA